MHLLVPRVGSGYPGLLRGIPGPVFRDDLGNGFGYLVGEFAGLTGTQARKRVLAASGLAGARLGDLVVESGIDRRKATALLDAMKESSRRLPVRSLGILGREAFTGGLPVFFPVEVESLRYRVKRGEDGGLPWVMEVAFGHDPVLRRERALVVGVNWSPCLEVPFDKLFGMLEENYVEEFDPCVMAVHLVMPRCVFTDRGKAQLAVSESVECALAACVESVTKPWTEMKRRERRETRVHERMIEEAARRYRAARVTIKDAAYRVMEQAYLETSDGNRLPANVRQIMYVARPEVLKLTGGQCWKDSSSFTQRLLPDYMRENPEQTADWDVVFDDRGHWTEPHTGATIGLGTLSVRSYIAGWREDFDEVPGAPRLAGEVPTSGPANRFRFALFIEKEGFGPLLDRAQISSRFGIAVMSTKGMSVTAARMLVEEFSRQGVTILVLHDFDKSGFSILHTLGHDTRRYRFKHKPNVIDLGLRLKDVGNLQSEFVAYNTKMDPRINLRENGATEEECAFLVERQVSAKRWEGKRGELNAPTPRQFIALLEAKLTGHGVAKVIPNKEVLEKGFRRATRLVRMQGAIDALAENTDAIEMPKRLEDQVRGLMKGNGMAWDEAVFKVAISAFRG